MILVCGTATEVGKTWVSSRLLAELRSRNVTVSARKPAQSFDIDSEGGRLGGATDAERLGAASGEHPGAVCHSFRSYHRAMAPPMAAEALGLPPFTVAELIEEMEWPVDRVQVGVVETAGGVRSPQASDGDVVDVVAGLAPDVVVLVSDAGLGTINAVRMSMDALSASRPGHSPVPASWWCWTGSTTAMTSTGETGSGSSNTTGTACWSIPGEESELADLVSGDGAAGSDRSP